MPTPGLDGVDPPEQVTRQSLIGWTRRTVGPLAALPEAIMEVETSSPGRPCSFASWGPSQLP